LYIFCSLPIPILFIKKLSVCLSFNPGFINPDFLSSSSADIPRSARSRRGSVLIAAASQLQKVRLLSLISIARDSISPVWILKGLG